MSTPSLYETTGLSVNLYKPSVSFTAGSPNVVAVTPRGTHLKTITDEYTGLSFVRKAVGGYWSARIDVTDNLFGMEWWLQNAVGMHVEIADPGANIVWEGFVDQLSLNLAGLAITQGPLLDAANRVTVLYSPIRADSDVPYSNVQTELAVGEDDDSQRRFGILQEIISTRDVTAAVAAQIRDLFLAENAQPRLSRTLDLSGQAGDSVATLDCAGYVRRLQFPYVQVTTAGLGNLSTKIAAVLDADPNGFFASANAAITANTIQVDLWEEKDRDAWTVVRELVSLGDTTFNRYLFLVEANRYVTYAAMPTTVEYHQRVTDRRQSIETVYGARVAPWDVQPGKWLLTPDLMVGRTLSADLRQDPRAMFIEQMSYTAPSAGPVLQGGNADRVTQPLDQMGLQGIG